MFICLVFALVSPNVHAAPAVPSGTYDIHTYGAVADGKTKCTDSIRKAIAAAASKGGGTIFVPAGTYLTGPIHLQSNITLHLDAGAVLKFSNDINDYLPMVASRWEGVEVVNFSPLIYAKDAENIAIRGRGTLDGQGKVWWDAWERIKMTGMPALKQFTDEEPTAKQHQWEKEFLRRNPNGPVPISGNKFQPGTFLRPPFIQPYNCKNVLIEGVTVTNSPFWTVTPVYCENVTIHAVTVRNPESPNTDGINPDSCRNVHISDCDISVGDDCITIKSGRDADGRRVNKPAENYTITNCTMAHGHGGVVIGSEMSGGVKNITISNCVFDGTERGIRIKSSRGRGGVVEDVRVSNIVMRKIGREAIVLTTYYEKTEPEPVSERTPTFRNIRFNGITGDARIAGELTGLTEKPLENISLSDIQLDVTTGFTIKDAKEISFNQVVVNTEKGPGLAADKTVGLDVSGFRTQRPVTKTPLIDLLNVQNVFVHGCSAAANTDVFLRVQEKAASEVTLEGNNLKQAKEAIVKVPGTK